MASHFQNLGDGVQTYLQKNLNKSYGMQSKKIAYIVYISAITAVSVIPSISVVTTVAVDGVIAMMIAAALVITGTMVSTGSIVHSVSLMMVVTKGAALQVEEIKKIE